MKGFGQQGFNSRGNFLFVVRVIVAGRKHCLFSRVFFHLSVYSAIYFTTCFFSSLRLFYFSLHLHHYLSFLEIPCSFDYWLDSIIRILPEEFWLDRWLREVLTPDTVHVERNVFFGGKELFYHEQEAIWRIFGWHSYAP
ncbi:hypothetical protein CEXT_681611 [Caerostris extrusa]|uniref:Uncharacterized protein n=1 Tax=Caerostris extrusa TaxID=172846 RepID=A0AAV4XHK4_CAEEX|nr:hypothetical protein CEXT_681611 [Caerostris extrusa]